MCLGYPFRVIKITGPFTALAEAKGIKKEIYLPLLPEEVKVGDWVLVHVGFAIAKLKEKEALETISFWDEQLSSS